MKVVRLPGRLDFELVHGDTFVESVYLTLVAADGTRTPMPLSGVEIVMTIKKRPGGDDLKVLTSDGSDGITIVQDGEIQIEIPASEMEADFEPFKYVYNAVFTGSETKTYVAGDIIIKPRI